MRKNSIEFFYIPIKSDRRDSNPRPPPWQGGVLPTVLLSHLLSCVHQNNIYYTVQRRNCQRKNEEILFYFLRRFNKFSVNQTKNNFNRIIDEDEWKSPTHKIENILDQLIDILYSIYCSDEQQILNAIVVQLVVRHLAKVEVAGSSPVCRSWSKNYMLCAVLFLCIQWAGGSCSHEPWFITNVKKTGTMPVFHHNYSFFISRRTSILQMQQLRWSGR